MHVLAIALVVVHGLVMRGPTKPVCSMASPCDEPAGQVQLVFARAGSVVRVRTDASGHYRVKLRPGTYSLAGTSSSRLQRVMPASLTVRRPMRADFFIDTGI